MGCQREIAQQIVDPDSCPGQGQLHEGIRDLFAGAEALGFDGVPYDYSQTVNKGHGRVERRECWAITETDCLDYINPHGQWPQLGRHQSGRPSCSKYFATIFSGSLWAGLGLHRELLHGLCVTSVRCFGMGRNDPADLTCIKTQNIVKVIHMANASWHVVEFAYPFALQMCQGAETPVSCFART